jgi:hypothetical protein
VSIVTIFFEYVLQFSEINWLHEKIVATRFAGEREKGGFGMAGDKDNGHVPDVLRGAYPPCSVDAAQAREAAVHKNKVRPRALSRADSFLTIRCLDNTVTTKLQQGAEQETRVFVILGDKREGLRWGALRVGFLL